MDLTFYGAAHEVTGSCYLLEACGKNILIDCGMRQGGEVDTQQLHVKPGDIDCVLLTHAHIDHSGNLPLLYKNGFRGDIYATGATSKLCGIMLKDTAHILESEAEWKNRKAKRSGAEEIPPLYNMGDAEGVLRLFKIVGYTRVFELFSGISIRYIDAGHILGSATIEINIVERGKKAKIIFSGDIGNLNQPLINNPEYPADADYAVIESTYGNRLHNKSPKDYAYTLADVLQSTFDKSGNVIIPAFAVGRTQEVLYFLRKIKEESLVKGHGDFPVYVDSPLAIEATNIFGEQTYGYYDTEALDLLRKGINPIGFSNLRIALTSDESKMINFDKVPKVIISASGMCEAGRIRHHLKHNLWREECTILFSGYQAKGTLGRNLLEGAKKVRLFGEEIQVRAQIVDMEGISAHADQEGLLLWLKHISTPVKRIFVVHGDSVVTEEFAQFVIKETGISACAPFLGDGYDLLTNFKVREGVPMQPSPRRTKAASSAFELLRKSGERLARIISKKQGLANKELEKFTKEIDLISNKWDR